VCRHLDGNPANNHISNLGWGTNSENTQDRLEHGTMFKVRLSPEQQSEIVWMVGYGATKREVSEQFNISVKVVNRVLKTVA
jgi:DNA-binding CsgD family transcriptional regulator